MYSLHVMGLVLDTQERVAYMCDPNGPLLPGGNMEFITVPTTPISCAPSTAFSRFDREQQDQKRKKPKRFIL
jgi:hypothetical protein